MAQSFEIMFTTVNRVTSPDGGLQQDGVGILDDGDTAGATVAVNGKRTLHLGQITPFETDMDNVISPGDTVKIYVASIFGFWNGVTTLYAYTTDSGITTSNAITLTNQVVGAFATFTMTQAFIDELVIQNPGTGSARWAIRFITNAGSGHSVHLSEVEHTFGGQTGVTKFGFADVSAEAIAGGVPSRLLRRTSSVSASATALATGGARRIGTASIECTAVVSAVGGAIRNATASVTATASSDSQGGARRSGTASVSVTATVVAAGVKTGAGNAVVICTAIALAVGGKTGEKAGNAHVSATATALAIAGAIRPGNAAVTCTATVSAQGGKRSGGNASVTCIASATALGGALRLGHSTVTSMAIANAFGGARRPALAGVTCTAVSGAEGRRVGTVQIDKESDQILSIDLESLSLVSTGVEWLIV